MMDTSLMETSSGVTGYAQVVPAQPAPASSSLRHEAHHGQATINIGVIGHVAHGKSTLVRAMTGTKTMRHKAEMARNITIKLGYADAKIYKCGSSKCARPACYSSCGGNDDLGGSKCQIEACDGTYKLQRHISFVDCPGHEVLMRTMVSGASVMDAALLLVSANESCPQPQTEEHLAALESTGLKRSSIIVVQNKVDLVGPQAAAKHAQSIQKYLKGTVADGAPIIPISAHFNINIDAVLDCITHVTLPSRILASPARMTIVRSYDVNRPGCGIQNLKGGVAGGSLLHGILRLHDDVEIRPGLVTKDAGTGKMKWKPLRSSIESLSAESKQIIHAVPGGLIGVGTKIAPELCRGDRLVGQVMGHVGSLPPVFQSLTFQYSLLRRTTGSDARGKVSSLFKGEAVLINIGSSSTLGTIMKANSGIAVIELARPICAELDTRVSLSRKIGEHWRLIGYGTIVDGMEADRIDKS